MSTIEGRGLAPPFRNPRITPTMNTVARRLAAACLALGLAACSKPADRVEITGVATRSETRAVPQVNVSSEDRFARALPQTPPNVAAPASAAAVAGSELFDYEAPAGWNAAAPSQFRDPSFTIGPTGEIECYVSVLDGQGGGLLVNANRWRGQLGQAPYAESEFGSLPRANILGQEAVIVDFTGSYMGMGAAEAKPGYRLVGALIQAPMAAIFIKMVGPDAMVETEKNNFALFAQSLRMKGAAGAPATAAADPGEQISAPDAAPPAPDNAAAPAAFTWKTPDGWTESPAGSPMRVVTFRFGPNSEGECYIATLPGQAGGRLENFNRWLTQMGEPPLEETELELQPPVFMFEEEVPMLITKGTYTGMDGDAHPGFALLGALAELDGQSVFVKLVAPEALANEHSQRFAAFCAGLRKK